VQEAITRLHDAFSERIADGLKNLFQVKHLYQNVTIEFADLGRTAFSETDNPTFVKNALYNIAPKFPGLWFPFEATKSGPELQHKYPIFFSTPDVKLFCENCERIEAFNSISTEDFLRREAQNDKGFSSKRGIVQVFVFSFLCQACKMVPEVFIVRRENFKLVLSGRAPIEHIQTPTVIPKHIKRFYSGAIVAYQSGQTLAGIFLLRTLIEQWAQSVAAKKDLQADEAIESYLATLPADFKDRFPSLRILYSDLSLDIHTATGSAELFEKARNQIDEHFEARRLFKLG
jgi:hypothetical protein